MRDYLEEAKSYFAEEEKDLPQFKTFKSLNKEMKEKVNDKFNELFMGYMLDDLNDEIYGAYIRVLKSKIKKFYDFIEQNMDTQDFNSNFKKELSIFLIKRLVEVIEKGPGQDPEIFIEGVIDQVINK